METLKMRALTFISALFMLALPVAGRAELRDDFMFYGEALESVNQTTGANKTYVCGTLVHEVKSCSKLFNLFERDKSTGFFFGMISDSPWDACKKSISSAKEISLNELEKKLAGNNRTSLGLRNDYFTSRIEQCYPENKRVKKEDADNQKKMIVTMGYDYLNRLKKSTGQFAEEVKRLNSILGEPVETGLPCSDFSMPHDSLICQDIKKEKCKSINELAFYTNTLYENAIEPIVALKKTHAQLFEKFSKTRTMRRPENQEALKDITNKIKSIEAQFPILKGKMLASFMSSETEGGRVPSRNKIESAVKAQLQENRANVVKKLNENIDMNNCLVYGDESFCKKFSDHFERVPAHEDVSFFEKSGTDRLKNLAATELYNTNQCLDNFRGLKNEFNSFAADFSINVGLTLFTGGTGLLARAGGQGVKVALAGHKAMLVADAAFLGAGVEEAISTCSKELNKLETIAPEKLNSNKTCPAPLSSPENVLVSNYQGCVTGAMMASLNALPFVPAAVSKYLKAKGALSERAVASEVGDLMKFKAPKKAFDPHDLRTAGTILPAGKAQSKADVFKRDGVYVYIVDDKGNMVISHRTPDLRAGTKEGDQYLGTHRGLYNKLSEKGEALVVSAGEIRVIGGVPVKVSPRAGSFHNTPEEVLMNMGSFAKAEEKKTIDALLNEYKKIPAKDRSDPMMVEMYIEDFLDVNPGARDIFNKMQSQLSELADKRLAIVKEGMEKRGLLSKDIETKFSRDVGGDAHVEGKAAAIAEINCYKNKSCADQLAAYQGVAKKFLEKYKSVDKIEDALVAKMMAKQNEGSSKKDQVFRFLNQRSALLFKEGPIEFIQSSNPEKLGLSADDVFKYMDEWSRQF